MKMKWAIALGILLVTVLLLCSCNAPAITRTYIDEEFHIVAVYEDGTEAIIGKIDAPVTITGTSVNADKHLIVSYSDGTTQDLGYVGVVDTSLNVTVADTSVNEEKHLIVTYSDGTTKDLGYVGVEVQVEVLPPLYTVTFLDASGNTLSTEEVYKGTGAKAPEAPQIADKVFSGWDVDFSNVQSDLTVRPIYGNMAEYLVTFKDDDGTILKTQTVVSGKSATAPTPPKKSDRIFTGWDKKFSSVTEDLVVTAQYRAKNTYTVTFKDYNGLVISGVSVKEGDAAKAPANPTRDGYRFTGWSSSVSNVTSNMVVTARYSLNTGDNILDISYHVSGNKLTVTFSVKGTVKLCGMEGTIAIPAGLIYDSHEEGDGVTANQKNGVIYYVFTSNNGKDITAETELLTLTFTCASTFESGKLAITVADIYDQNYATVSYKVIGETVRVK